MALDLSLDKMIADDEHQGVGTIDSKRALAIDGFPDVEPASWLGRRLLRSRQRAWLSLFVLDRGFALARGRLSMVPMSPAISCCDRWHKHEDADGSDASIAGAAVLRREIVSVLAGLALARGG